MLNPELFNQRNASQNKKLSGVFNAVDRTLERTEAPNQKKLQQPLQLLKFFILPNKKAC